MAEPENIKPAPRRREKKPPKKITEKYLYNSGLAYLQRFPFDSIKIDKRFINGLNSSGGRDRAVVQAIINLGEAMGLTVTAEGVESEQQLKALEKDRCHEVQGFYMSRPLDSAGVAALLHQTSHSTAKPL